MGVGWCGLNVYICLLLLLKQEDERPHGEGLLTEWSKPYPVPLSEQLEVETKLYKIHSALPGTEAFLTRQ